MAQRGAFIVFEGLDRCGKSTQSSLLVEALKKRQVAADLWRFPDRTTPFGKQINSYLTGEDANDNAIHLLFSANRWEKRKALLEALRSGTTLVVDRYAYSGVAYSAAKGTEGLSVDWCKAPDAGLPAPDLVVLLMMPQGAATAAEREGFGAERYEKIEFQDKVRAAFASVVQPEVFLQLDASRSIEDLHAQVMEQVDEVMRRCQEGEPIRRLWDYAPLTQHGEGERNPFSPSAS